MQDMKHFQFGFVPGESNVSSSSSRQVGRNPSIYKKSPIDMDEILNHPIQRHQKPHLKNQGGQSRNLANSIGELGYVHLYRSCEFSDPPGPIQRCSVFLF